MSNLYSCKLKYNTLMKKTLLSILCVGLLVFSCKKPEDKLQNANPNLSGISSGSETLIEVSDADGMNNGEVTYTIIGDQYDFPFKTETIRQAWNNLNTAEHDLAELHPTHKYVKFSPQDIEQIATLQKPDCPYLIFRWTIT